MSRAGRITLLVCVALVLLGRSAAAQEAVEYYATDALGSVRVVYAANGSLKGRMDFGPYGDQLVSAEGVGDKVFAQVKFDGESAMATPRPACFSPGPDASTPRTPSLMPLTTRRNGTDIRTP